MVGETPDSGDVREPACAPGLDVTDVITLSLPRDERFVGVARMVVGGLASRLDLSYERLDDLQLAVETVLGEYAAGGEVTLEILVRAGAIEVLAAPLDVDQIAAELDGSTAGVGLGVLLRSTVDAVGFEDRDGMRWLRLTKQAPVRGRQ